MIDSRDTTLPWAQLFAAAGRDEVDAALRDAYAAIDRDIAARNPTCWLSGKCCHFETYGHRLYITALEAAWLIGQLDDAQRQALADTDPTPLDGCVFQTSKLCGVHAIRPLGCRVFFCDPSADWQNEVYETHLRKLRDLHEQLGVPYCYMEWRAALSEAKAQYRDSPGSEEGLGEGEASNAALRSTPPQPSPEREGVEDAPGSS